MSISFPKNTRLTLSLSALLVSIISICVGGVLWYHSTPTAQAKAVASLCEHAEDKREDVQSCYATEFRKIAREHGDEYAFSILDELQVIDEEARFCHFIAHALGYGAYEHDPANWESRLSEIRKSCVWGALHGIVEIGLSVTGEQIIPKDIIPKCRVSNTNECGHAVGHVVLAENKGNTEVAVSLCNEIDSYYERKICLDGIFMEEVFGAYLTEHGVVDEETYKNRAARLPEVMAICERQEGLAHRACWRQLSQLINENYNYDPTRLYESCFLARDKEAKIDCFLYGGSLLLRHNSVNVSKIPTAICGAEGAPDWLTKACIVQQLRFSLYIFPDDLQQISDFCGSTDSIDKESCYAVLGSFLMNARAQHPEYSMEERRAICTPLVPEEYVPECMRGYDPETNPMRGVNSDSEVSGAVEYALSLEEYDRVEEYQNGSF